MTMTGQSMHWWQPAISGQFGPDVTIGKIRTALKHLGFTGMEVAVFADILTMKEALGI